jgi:hypothetical protein
MPAYQYVVDLDERGDFRAHVETDTGACVFEFNNEDPESGGSLWMVEDGFMRNAYDTDGLLDYLVSMGFAPAGSTLLLHS